MNSLSVEFPASDRPVQEEVCLGRRKSPVPAAAAAQNKHVTDLKPQLRGSGLVFLRLTNPFAQTVGSNRRCYWERHLVLLSLDLTELTS